MKANFSNTITSSFLLYLDHRIVDKGDGYSNVGSNFYPVSGIYQDKYTYAAPYKQLINDNSIGNATKFSGIYLNNNLITPGTSGFIGIDHYNGQLLFSSGLSSPTISGNYSVKDFNLYTTDKSEETLLFLTKIEQRPRLPQTARGLAPNEITYPAIFLRMDDTTNDPFAFGGTDMTKFSYRAIVMANSMYNLDSACGILRDSSHNFFRTIDNSSLHLNAFGCSTGQLFNYTGAATGEPIYISNVAVKKVQAMNSADFVNLNPNVYSAFVDFELEAIRDPHSS